MSSEHIDRFNIVALSILQSLHANFPAAFHPTPVSIGLTDEVPQLVGGVRQVTQEYEVLALEVRQTLAFLVDEGFVIDRGHRIGPSHVMTATGLRALERIDPSCPAPVIAAI